MDDSGPKIIVCHKDTKNYVFQKVENPYFVIVTVLPGFLFYLFEFSGWSQLLNFISYSFYRFSYSIKYFNLSSTHLCALKIKNL